MKWILMDHSDFIVLVVHPATSANASLLRHLCALRIKHATQVVTQNAGVARRRLTQNDGSLNAPKESLKIMKIITLFLDNHFALMFQMLRK